MASSTRVPPYATLAAIYDAVMAHVDYDEWAAHAHALLQEHHAAPEDVLELGCGTGSLAVRLQPMGPYRYTATDGQAAMLRIARAKAERAGVPVRFRTAQFTDFAVEAPADAVVLLYDGLNYLVEEEQISALFARAHAALRPGGVFIFDQSTPANSEENAAFFFDEGTTGGVAYVRESRYDAERGLHTTTFQLTADGQTAREEHVQRAYPAAAIRRLLEASPLDEAAAYDGFTAEPATEASHRVHWVARRRA